LILYSLFAIYIAVLNLYKPFREFLRAFLRGILWLLGLVIPLPAAFLYGVALGLKGYNLCKVIVKKLLGR